MGRLAIARGERELGPLAAGVRADLLVRIETGLLYALLRERLVPGRLPQAAEPQVVSDGYPT